MNLIIVDDDKVIRIGIRKIVEKYQTKFNVIGDFKDGSEAYEFLKESNEVDLVITDIKMPIMDGIELSKKISELDKKIKRI